MECSSDGQWPNETFEADVQRPAHLLLTPTPHPTRAIGSGLIPNRGKGSASLKNSQNLHFCARELANLHTP